MPGPKSGAEERCPCGVAYTVETGRESARLWEQAAHAMGHATVASWLAAAADEAARSALSGYELWRRGGWRPGEPREVPFDPGDPAFLAGACSLHPEQAPAVAWALHVLARLHLLRRVEGRTDGRRWSLPFRALLATDTDGEVVELHAPEELQDAAHAALARFRRPAPPPSALPATLPAPAPPLGPYRRWYYERLPSEPRCELLYGTLHFFPAPPPAHEAAVAALFARLEDGARRGGLVTRAVPAVLADHSVALPDLAYLDPAHAGFAREWIEGPPDLAVEVLSPGTARRDRGEKLALYAEAGVREVWLADPAARTFEVRVARERRQDGLLLLPPAGQAYRTALLPGLSLDLSALWREVEGTVHRAP